MPLRPPPARAGVLFRLFAAVSFLLALASCGGGSGAVQAEADTTVLVYVIATNLEENADAASDNLAEMQSVAPNDKVNLVLATGGSRKPGWDTLQRKRVLGSKIELIEDLGKKDMGQVSTLQDFIEWGVKAYPAKRYMLVLWDHGGGPNGGVGPDSATGSVLSLPMLTEAVSNARASTGAHFDLIGFDACLMASVEIAQAFAPHANYLLASQELEPGGGWDWKAFMQALTSNPKVDVESFGKTVIDAYIAKQMADDPFVQSTLSLTDLSRMGPVVNELETIAASLQDRLSADSEEARKAWYDIVDARSRGVSFLSPRLMPGLDLVDPNFLSWYGIGLPDGQYEKLEAALRDAVRYERHTDVYPELSGLSMYLPQRTLSDEAMLAKYAALDFSKPVQSFVSKFAAVGNKDGGIVPLPDVGSIEIKGPNHCATVDNPESMAYGFAGLGMKLDALTVIIATKPPASPDGGEESSAVELCDDNPSGGWPSIGEGDRVPVVMIPNGERFAEDDPYRYIIPVVVEIDNDPENRFGGLLFVRSDEMGALRIVSFLQDMLNDSPTVARPDELPMNARYAPRYMVVGENGSLPQWTYDPSRFVELGEDPIVHQDMSSPDSAMLLFGAEDHRGYMAFNPLN